MKRLSKIALTIVLLFTTIEFVRSNVLFYTTDLYNPEVASRIGNAGCVLLLAITLLVVLNTKEKTNE